MTKPISVDFALDASIAQVWDAWTQPALLTQWLTEKAKVEAVVGGAYELFWEPDHPERNSTLGCKLTAVEPHARLAFTWRGPVPYAHLMNVSEPPPTHVSVRFESRGDTTAVRFEHLGWGSGKEWDEARAWQEKAWRGAFERLARLMPPRGRTAVASAGNPPRLYRVILPAKSVEQAVQFYRQIFGVEGRRVSRGRHYFDTGEVILAVVDPRADGDSWDARANADHVYFAVDDVDAFYQKVKGLGWSELDERVETRPWGERSFYGKDPTGNPICFVQAKTVFTGK